MHPRHMVGHLGAQVALLLVAAALLSLLGPSTGQAKDAQGSERVLLVKCDAPEVPMVVAALAPLEARVYDLKTMAQLHASCPQGVVRPLPSAAEAMAALREALAGVPKAGGVRLTELRVAPTKLSAALELAEPTTADAIPAVLGEHRYFAERAAQVRLGAMTREHGTWTLRLSLDLGTSKPRKIPPTRRLDHIPTLELHRLELAHKLKRMYMSAEKVTFEQRRGARTISREVTYEAGATLDDLTAFLAGLGKEDVVTVSELRWKREDGETLGKIALRVALRTPYAP